MMKLFTIADTSFENFDTSVKNYLSKIFGQLGQQYTHNLIFGIIFDGIKGIMQNVMFYIEDAFTELNVFTAARKKSIYSLAKLSGYEGYYGSAATGNILLTLNINNGISEESVVNKLYIPNGTRIINNNTGLTYILDLPINTYVIDVSKAFTTHTFKVIEGQRLITLFTANGYLLETFSITTSSLFDKNYINVYVNGEEYEQVSNLYEMQQDEKCFVVSVGYDSTFLVMFGDGIHGKQLESGQTVQVEYITHHGILGNIGEDGNADLTFYDYGTDGSDNSIDINDYLDISINDYITGGTQSDTISTVKSMIGYNSRSNVLANENNYKLFLKRFSFVGYCNIWSLKNSMIVSANIIQDVSDKIESSEDYFTLQDSDYILTDNQKDIIKSVLNNSDKTVAGVSLNFVDPVIRRYAIYCYIKTDSSYNRESVKTTITNSIAEYFMNLEYNTTFISKSDIIKKVLDENEDITFFDITFISKLEEDAFYNGYYTKYELNYVNGTYEYKQTKVLYSENGLYGLDSFGNIQLDSKLEIPIIGGGFKYYADKSNKNSDITIDGITCLFI